MGIITEIKNYLQKSEPLTFDVNSWLGLTRTTRIRYDSDSAFTAYRAHELVYACINKIADVMNDAEIIVEVKKADGEWEKKDGHLLPALFKRPNSYQTGRDVRRLMVQSEQGMGKFYAHIERSRAGFPVAMTVLNPNRVKPVFDQAQNRVLYYEYQAGNGRPVPIKIEDLIIRRRPDLLDQFNGFAPLSAALKSINADLGLGDYIDSFFESDGVPSGILKVLNRTLTEPAADELSAKWRRKYGRGGSNQKGTAVLDQNADFQRIGSNLNELASDSLSDRFESRICAVFGVPPNLVGANVGLRHVTANATAKAELQNFWDNKISGELSTLREWLTWFVLPEFEDIEQIRAETIRVSFDIAHVAYLQEDVENLHKRARETFKAGGCTLNEFRADIGLKPDPDGDYYLQPLNLTAISPENRAKEAFEEVVEPEPVPAQLAPAEEVEETPDDTQDEEQPKSLEKKTFDLDGLILGREPRGVEMVIDLKKIANDYETERERCISILKKFRVDLITQAVSKLEKLDSATAHTLTLTPDPKRRKEIGKTIQSAYRSGREQIIAELTVQQSAKGNLFIEFTKAEDEEDFLEEVIDNLISKIINEITSRAVNEYLVRKLLADFVVEKLTDVLIDQSEKFIDSIAGAAVNAAMSSGRDDEIKDNIDQVEYVEYSAILDQNTCGYCEDADGETAADPLDLPQAPNPECEGGDRCRCIHVAVAV
jgi:HK97 family phage portal protein